MFIPVKLGIKLTSQGFANSFNTDWAHWGSGGERTTPVLLWGKGLKSLKYNFKNCNFQVHVNTARKASLIKGKINEA